MSEIMDNNPMKVWSDINKQNIDMWQQMQGMWLGNSGKKDEKPDEH
jgi:hypothetical protein